MTILKYGYEGLSGVGGIYFLAEPGELTVEVAKEDLSSSKHTELRAILVGPDREVLQETIIPDSSAGSESLQSVILRTVVERTGVYGLNITVSQDRYGDEIIWGFRTNNKKYLIETSRGHRDARHKEPIVLRRDDRPGDVCFLPRTGSFSIKVEDIHEDVEKITVYNGKGEETALLKVQEDNTAAYSFKADRKRGDTPWRLHLPVAHAEVHIGGVTQWQDEDLYQHMAVWTPEMSSWFSLLEHRWLITPHRKTAYGNPGKKSRIAYRIFNNSAEEKRINLSLEFPDRSWPVSLSQNQIDLGSKEEKEVDINCKVPLKGANSVHLRARPEDDPEFTTYSTLTVRAGKPPANKPIDLPFALRPYEHQNEQLGYLPEYPVASEVYFDLNNRPYVRIPGGISTRRNEKWANVQFNDRTVRFDPHIPDEAGTKASLFDSEQKRTSLHYYFGPSKIAFDADNDLYMLEGTGTQTILLHSDDEGRTFQSYIISGNKGKSQSFDIEQFSGHNVPEGPPPFVRYTRKDEKRDSRYFWRRVNDIELFIPRKEGGRIVIRDPILLSKKCIGLSQHSGIPSSVVSKGSKVHVIWGEATDPEKEVPGVPTYVATYDVETGKLGDPALIGYGAPPNDGHNSPSITMDSRGYLHALAGTHGQPFQYARSLEPNDAHAGWTEPVSLDARQTYIGLVCDHEDTLHLAFRMWERNVEPFPASTHARLAYQRKKCGQKWEEPLPLVLSAFSEYSIFYHRLTIDRSGQVFLSHDYYTTYWFYRNDQRYRHRALLTTTDGGDTWKLW